MPIWGWLCCGLVVAFVMLSVYIRITEARTRERYENGADSFVGWIVQANNVLYQPGVGSSPAMVLIGFDGVIGELDFAVGDLARRVAQLKHGEADSRVEEDVALLVRDESYRPFQWNPLPEEFTGGLEVYSVHVWIERKFLPEKVLKLPFVRCLAFPDQPNSRVIMDHYRDSDERLI